MILKAVEEAFTELETTVREMIEEVHAGREVLSKPAKGKHRSHCSDDRIHPTNEPHPA